MNHELTIESPKLSLRKLTTADTAKVFKMSQEECMRSWLPTQVYRDITHADSVVKFLISQYDTIPDPRTRPMVLGIQLKQSGDLIGHVGLSALFASVEVGFAIEECQQRKGYATEAVRAMCTWATAVCSLNNILGVTAKRNIASQGVLVGAGFVREREQVMELQGVEQPVVIYEFARAR